MRVVQVIPDFGLGGIQKAGCVLAVGLAGHGCQTLVASRQSGPRFEAAPPAGVTHRVVAGATARELAAAILEFQPDAVHIHDAAYDEPLVAALAEARGRAAGGPLVVSTPVFGRPPKSRATLRQTKTAVVGTYILYRLRHWLGMSLDEALRAGVAFTPVVSFQPTDPPHSALDPPATRAARRAEFGIAADAEVIGRVGRSAPEKWSPANVELVNGFLAARPRGVWLSVGMPDTLGLEGLKARWGGRFVNLPQSSDYGLLAKAFASMDAQVFFSCYGECFAATICEPAGLGVPTIAGTNPIRDNGQSEQVVEGVTGRLVASVGGALEQLCKLFDDPVELARLKQSTHDYARARWTPAKISADLLALFEAWRTEDPLTHPRMRAVRDEAAAFDAGYLARMLALHAPGGAGRLAWRAKLAAVRSWPLFRAAAALKRALGR